MTFNLQVWQSSEDALLQMVVVVLVRLGSKGAPATGWHSLGTGIQLLVVSRYQNLKMLKYVSLDGKQIS